MDYEWSPPHTFKLAVIYARTSTDEQTVSLDEQVRICREWCSQRGIGVLLEVKEHASGAKPPEERPEFRKILQLLDMGVRFDVLVVYSLDRLTRSVRRLHKLLLDFSQRGVAIISVREEWTWRITEPEFRDFLIHALGTFAQWWLRNIRERTRIAMRSEKVREKLDSLRVVSKIPDDTKTAIAILYRQGYSMRKLARMFNLSVYAIRKILVEKGVIRLPEDICPRCLHKMTWDDVEEALRCEKCGYVKKQRDIG